MPLTHDIGVRIPYPLPENGDSAAAELPFVFSLVCLFSFVCALRCRCLPARVGSPPRADLFRGSFSGLLDCRRLRSVVRDRFLGGLRLVRCGADADDAERG